MLEIIEAELKKKLEEIERRKRRLKELEEEEQKILNEISELGRGTIVAKWVKCGKGCKKCPHGPYYYLVWKENGKTKWKYLGKIKHDPKVKNLKERLKEIRKEKRELLKIKI